MKKRHLWELVRWVKIQVSSESFWVKFLISSTVMRDNVNFTVLIGGDIDHHVSSTNKASTPYAKIGLQESKINIIFSLCNKNISSDMHTRKADNQTWNKYDATISYTYVLEKSILTIFFIWLEIMILHFHNIFV